MFEQSRAAAFPSLCDTLSILFMDEDSACVKRFSEIAANEWKINVFCNVVEKQIFHLNWETKRKTFEWDVISWKSFSWKLYFPFVSFNAVFLKFHGFQHHLIFTEKDVFFTFLMVHWKLLKNVSKFCSLELDLVLNWLKLNKKMKVTKKIKL